MLELYGTASVSHSVPRAPPWLFGAPLLLSRFSDLGDKKWAVLLCDPLKTGVSLLPVVFSLKFCALIAGGLLAPYWRFSNPLTVCFPQRVYFVELVREYKFKAGFMRRKDKLKKDTNSQKGLEGERDLTAQILVQRRCF